MKINAYLTVYMTLTLTILLSLSLALIEGARQNAVFLEAECVSSVAMDSILAEYHRELLTQYNLFAIDSSYGGAVPSVHATEDHLKHYLEKNFSVEDVFLDWLFYRDFQGMKLESADVTKVSFLTDEGGRIFRRRAAEAVWDDKNLNLFHKIQGWMNTVDSEQLVERDIAEEKRKLDKELDKYDGKEVQISETEWITIEIKNPTEALEKKRREGILKWIVPDAEALSTNTLSTDALIMSRMENGAVNCGNIELPELSEADRLLERFFFQEYLMSYMGHYGAESEKDALKYQIEYLLVGKDSDLDNLKSVANMIFAMREAANTSYVMMDMEKTSIAEALAAALATAMAVPEASEIFKLILLYGWAFAESIHDMKCLMDGQKVPLIKDKNTWYYDLDKALELGGSDTDAYSEGLTYKDYLRILMLLQKEDVLTGRAMNMAEADIRQTPGNEFFRLDGCIDYVEADIKVKSMFGYECEIVRGRGYSAG